MSRVEGSEKEIKLALRSKKQKERIEKLSRKLTIVLLVGVVASLSFASVAFAQGSTGPR